MEQHLRKKTKTTGGHWVINFFSSKQDTIKIYKWPIKFVQIREKKKADQLIIFSLHIRTHARTQGSAQVITGGGRTYICVR